MRFQYDPAKDAANVRKHGVWFADAEGVFEDLLALLTEDPDALGERRYVAIGFGRLGELLVIVYSERGDEYRLISARRATRKERRAYEG
jgi:uncharacterized DUF497 family protein